MSDSNNGDGTDTSVLENVDAEELLEGTQLEDAIEEDDENLGESIGRAVGAVIGRQIGELVGRKITERLSGGGDADEEHELTVSIENGDGDPVQGATVTAKGEDSSLIGGLIGVGENQETDDDGEVTFQLANGDYAIEADADEGSAAADVTIDGDDEERSLTIEQDEGDEAENEGEEGGQADEAEDENGDDEGDENGDGEENEADGDDENDE